MPFILLAFSNKQDNYLEYLKKETSELRRILLGLQDKLEYEILESFPEQIPFSLKPGATDDIRSHSHVFALRSNVKWSVKVPK